MILYKTTNAQDVLHIYHADTLIITIERLILNRKNDMK